MDHSELVSQFMGLTGTSQQNATFYLEGANWDVQTAAEEFYEADPEVEGGWQPPVAAPNDVPPAPPAGASRQAVADAQAPRQPPKPKAKAAPRGGITGFSDLAQAESDSEEDDGNEYYTGGEKSGQVVKGNDKKKTNVEEYFEQMRNREHASEYEGPNPGEESGRTVFAGRSRRLEDSGPAEDQPATAEAGASENPTTHVITFYADDVFTINDGEPREVRDPANRVFLEQLSRGQCPDEILPPRGAAYQENIQVELKRVQTKYEAPKKVAKPFSGQGRTLAGDAAGPSSSAGASQSARPPPTAPQGEWEGVDESKPITSLQLRLADGSRMVARFNTDHTIADIRRFIRASARESPAAYRLATAFPAAELTDDTKTISEANLANAVIVQKR